MVSSEGDDVMFLKLLFMFIDPVTILNNFNYQLSTSLFASPASKTSLCLTDYIILAVKLSRGYAIILVISFKTEKNVFQLKPIDTVKYEPREK